MMQIFHYFVQTWSAILRDKAVILLLFIAGFIYSFFYPLPYHYELVEAIPTHIVVTDYRASSQDGELEITSSAQTLVQLLTTSPTLDIQAVHADLHEAQQALWRGDIMAIMLIPEDFHQNILAGKQANVQLASHGGYLFASSKALASANQVILAMGATISLQKLEAISPAPVDLDTIQPIRLHARHLYNAHEGYGHSIVPAVMVLIIQQTLLIGVTLLLGLQAETSNQPRGRHAYFGMLLTFTSVGWLNAQYFFMAALQLQDYQQVAQFWSLQAFSLLFALSIAAFALLLARAFKTRERGLQVLLVMAIPLLFLSGYSWPVEALPPTLQFARWLVPSTAGIHGFISINQMGAGLSDLLPELLSLSLFSLVAISWGLYVYRQR